jgi:hypothetical protein
MSTLSSRLRFIRERPGRWWNVDLGYQVTEGDLDRLRSEHPDLEWSMTLEAGPYSPVLGPPWSYDALARSSFIDRSPKSDIEQKDPSS